MGRKRRREEGEEEGRGGGRKGRREEGEEGGRGGGRKGRREEGRKKEREDGRGGMTMLMVYSIEITLHFSCIFTYKEFLIVHFCAGEPSNKHTIDIRCVDTLFHCFGRATEERGVVFNHSVEDSMTYYLDPAWFNTNRFCVKDETEKHQLPTRLHSVRSHDSHTITQPHTQVWRQTLLHGLGMRLAGHT